MLDFLKTPFLILHFSFTFPAFLYINDLPDDVICDIGICGDDNALYSKCDQAFDLWQQLEWASELEPDLRDTVDWGKKWLVDFNAGETQLISFDWPNNNGSTDMKMDAGPILDNGAWVH